MINLFERTHRPKHPDLHRSHLAPEQRGDLIEAVFRLIPGAIGKIESALDDSFSEDLLGTPVWTKPAEFLGAKVPQVLIEGNHARQQKYRRWAALSRTVANRPDLLWRSDLTDEDRQMMQQIAAGKEFDNCF